MAISILLFDRDGVSLLAIPLSSSVYGSAIGITVNLNILTSLDSFSPNSLK